MRKIFVSFATLLVASVCAFGQGTQPIRNQFTTNNAMNAPQNGWIAVWNAAAARWSNVVNTATSTNLPAYLQTGTLTNLQGTGLSPGATNAGFYIGSSAGRGTNTTFQNVTNIGTLTNAGQALFGDNVYVGGAIGVTALGFQGGSFTSSGFVNGDRVVATGVGPNASLEESAVTVNELNYLTGVTGGIQGQIDNRIANLNGRGTNTDIVNLLEVFGSATVATNLNVTNNIVAGGGVTANGAILGVDGLFVQSGGTISSATFASGDRVIVTGVGPNAALEESVVTTDELNRLSGVTGGIQTNLNNRIANLNGRGTNTAFFISTNVGAQYWGGAAGTQVYSWDTGASEFRLIFSSGNTILTYGTNGHTHSFRGIAVYPTADGDTSLGDSTHRWNGGFFQGTVKSDGTNGERARFHATTYSGTPGQYSDLFLQTANGTEASPSIILSGNTIGKLSYYGEGASGNTLAFGIEPIALADFDTPGRSPTLASFEIGRVNASGTRQAMALTAFHKTNNVDVINNSNVFFQAISTNGILYTGASGQVRTAALSGLTFSGGVLTATGSGGGGPGTLPMNANQFDTNDPVTIKNGALLTNTSIRTALTLPTLTASRAALINGSNQLTNSANVTDTELEFLDGVTSAIQTQINNRQGGSAVLSNLVGTVANNVTNENSSALQINAGVMSLTPGVLSNVVASGHGAPYIAVGTNGGTLANVTNLMFRTSSVTLSNDSAGIASIHVAASGGSGSTNNVVTGEHFTTISNQLYRAPMNLGDTTNIVASFRTNQYIVAPSNSFTLTVSDLPQSGHKATIELFLINTNSAGGFFVTNGLNGGSIILLSAPSTNRFLIHSQTNALWVESGQILATGLSDVFVMQTNATIATATNVNPTIQDVSGDKFRFDLGAPSDSQALVFHPGSSGTIVTNGAASGGGGPTTNPPPYTVPITGTNFVIDVLSLGATNSIVLTNYAPAGLLITNLVEGKFIRIRVKQGSQGFNTLVFNTNHFGPNWRPTLVQTGLTQSTNGGYNDFFGIECVETNGVLMGQNWGARP